ncbi:polyprenol phosphomannose-dependent alpha 1,6 mannosyltransferase MptB [Streptomyces longispororuber]|uniref:polyprenol phosphomannose-dependent alpha 1,6 mannosyltransferase MptB n=1 Tax=Streptomyces longispororuber TaxID=68230 RepID=UPI00210DACF4|nr:polyprenol phosphomannose-dependent alpha 1,6 mannosyltransferase MptB [Streptomyces longispororuber]MCQ4207401.1 polyprenol phosphomannose-dependent alpha 1,6 mannosyltransferase MptB [Streptomyces longispororuber]
MFTPGDESHIHRCRLLGLTGSAALAVGGANAGALPVEDALDPASGPAAVGLFGAYFGLVLMVAAWLWLGQAVQGPRPPGRRSMIVTLAVWAAPLLVAPPLFSRDVYSYLAQGAMVDAHIDVYAHGPDRLGGHLAAQVPSVWQETPTPYGPVFLSFAALVARLTRAELSTGVLGLRGVALLGVALMVLALILLTRGDRRHCATGLWLGALNPLLLLHLVAGAHNDALMLGLLGIGLVAAQRRAPALGAVLVALAALVKAPAALGLLAVVALWAGQLDGRYRYVRAAGAATGITLACTAAVTALTGTGYGWIAALNTPITHNNWALTSVLGRATAAALGGDGSDLAALAVPAWRVAGLAIAGLTVLLLWLRGPRHGPLFALGLSLIAVAVLGPAIRPWYVLWGLFPLAAAVLPGRVRRTVAVASGVLALAELPSGLAPDGVQVAVATCGALVALGALWWARQMIAQEPRLGAGEAGSML